MRCDADVVEVVGVIGVQHGAVGDGQAEVHGPAAAGEMGEIKRGNAARILEPDGIVDVEIVAFAGDDHVIIAVIAHFARLAGEGGGDGTGHRERVALAFLAAETTAHAAGLHTHRMHGLADGMGDFVLNFGGVLGGGVDVHVAIFARQSEGGLAFKIEMFLAAHIDRAGQGVLRGLQGGFGFTLGIDARAVFEPAVRCESGFDG